MKQSMSDQRNQIAMPYFVERVLIHSYARLFGKITKHTVEKFIRFCNEISFKFALFAIRASFELICWPEKLAHGVWIQIFLGVYYLNSVYRFAFYYIVAARLSPVVFSPHIIKSTLVNPSLNSNFAYPQTIRQSPIPLMEQIDPSKYLLSSKLVTILK